MNDQLHAAATLHPGKELSHPQPPQNQLDRRLCEPQYPSGRRGENSWPNHKLNLDPLAFQLEASCCTDWTIQATQTGINNYNYLLELYCPKEFFSLIMWSVQHRREHGVSMPEYDRDWLWLCGIYGGWSGTAAGFIWLLQFPVPILIPQITPLPSLSIFRAWYNLRSQSSGTESVKKYR